APQQSLLQRMGTLLNISTGISENVMGHCEVAEHLVAQLGYGETIQKQIWQAYEHWDGSGFPLHVQGEALTLPIRVVHLIHDAETFRREAGNEAAIAIVRQRGGRLYDPHLASRFCENADRL